MKVNLSSIICPTFEEIVRDIVDCRVGRVVLNGGRASTKSQTASESIIIGCMTHKASAVALVKYGNKIKDRLVDTFSSSIDYLGVGKWWKLRKSPFEYVLLDKNGKETNVSIKFTGCDNADNLKSFRARSGGFRYVWFEELTNFSNLGEVNNIIQTMARGGESCVIMSYNPPISTSAWVNKEFNAPCGKILGFDSNTYTEEIVFTVDNLQYTVIQKVHHSSYLDVIEAGHSNWLGIQWIAEAEKSKLNNNEYYRWAYLGEVVGTDSNVFRNIHNWHYDETMASKQVDRGLDFSNGGSDPFAYTAWYYDSQNNDLYCLDEFGLGGSSSIEDVAFMIKQHNPVNLNVFTDSAVPQFTRQLCSAGIRAAGAKKGPDSRMAGIFWLKSVNHIYIDKLRTPNTYKEFIEYEYDMDKNTEEILPTIKDGNDHFIDSTRYALSVKILSRNTYVRGQIYKQA